MAPTLNPFAPGAGTPPPEMAGREMIIADAEVALGRIKAGATEKSQILRGLRGVGKTVLLNEIKSVRTSRFLLRTSVAASFQTRARSAPSAANAHARLLARPAAYGSGGR